MGQDVPVFTTTISVARLRDIIDAPNVVILDARFSLDDEQWGKQAYAQGHIPGALQADTADHLEIGRAHV